MNPDLAGAAWAALGAAAGVAVRWVSGRLAATEELDSSHGVVATLGPPVVSAVVLGLYGAAGWGDLFALGLKSVFALVFVQVIFFDLEHSLILDRVILPAAGLALVASLFRQPWWAGAATGCAAAALLLLMGAIGSALSGADAMGLGDVKLAAFIGLLLGPARGAEALAVGFIAAGVAAILIATWRRSFAGRLALGAYLAVGAITALYPLP